MGEKEEEGFLEDEALVVVQKLLLLSLVSFRLVFR